MRKKKDNFLLEQYKKSWKFFKESKNYILFSIILFFSLVLFGFIFPVFFKQEIFSFIEKITNEISGMNVFEIMTYIFLNNLKASFFAIILGVILGIFPVFTAIINGYVVGFVARHSVTGNGIFVLWRLLPHGIFELPAILISIGLGIKLGIELFRKDGKLKRNFIEAMRFFVFVIIPLLLIAGIVESILIFYFG